MATITRLKSPVPEPSFTSLPVLAESFRLSLEAQNKSPRTVQTHTSRRSLGWTPSWSAAACPTT